MLSRAATILSDSFWDYPEVLHVLPDQALRRRVLPRYLTADCVDAMRFNSFFGAFHGDVLSGVSAWLPPGAYPISRRREIAGLAYLSPVVPWVIARLPEVLRSQRAKNAGHTHEPHIYLCEIGVSRHAQGGGTGTALMQAMTDAADAKAVGCYLTTSAEPNTLWYRRFGFEVTETFRPTPAWPRIWRMWRNPH